jgi:hypothetical protein
MRGACSTRWVRMCGHAVAHDTAALALACVVSVQRAAALPCTAAVDSEVQLRCAEN